MSKKKVDIEFEEKDGKQKILGIAMVDTRQISFADFERMEKKINNLTNFIQKTFPEKPDPKNSTTA